MSGRPPTHYLDEEEAQIEHGDPDTQVEPPLKRTKGSYTCSLCPETFTEKRSLVRHARTVHAQSTRVQCTYCSETFARDDVRKRHERRKHSDPGQRPDGNGQDAGGATNSASLPDPGTVSTANNFDYLDFMNDQLLFDIVDVPLKTTYADGFYNVDLDTAIFPTNPPGKLGSLLRSSNSAHLSDNDSYEPSIGSNFEAGSSSVADVNVTPSTSHSSVTEDAALVPDTGSVDSTSTASISTPPDIIGRELLSDIDRMSIKDHTSILSVSSYQSARKRLELPLDLLKSRLSLIRSGATPRGRSRKTEIQCVLCKKPFGLTHTEIRSHLHQHSVEFGTTHNCRTCEIGFTHEGDFVRHEASAVKGSCGFNFDHANPCRGHHPPTYLQFGLSDHDRFQLWSRVRHWEQAQLHMYLSQVSALLSGNNVPPDIDSWSINVIWSRSMTSLSSRFSKVTTQSTPSPVEHSQRFKLSGARRPKGFLTRSRAPQERPIDKTLFLSAVLLGDVEECQRHLAAGADANRRSVFHDCTPLYMAAKRGSADVVELLIDYGAEVNNIDSTECGTALCVAAAKGMSKIVTLLLESGGVIDFLGPQGTALTCATRNGHLATMEILLKRGACAQVASASIQTPLLTACMKRNREAVKVLMDNRADELVASTQYISALLELAPHQRSCALLLGEYGNPVIRSQARVKAIELAFERNDHSSAMSLFEMDVTVPLSFRIPNGAVVAEMNGDLFHDTTLRMQGGDEIGLDDALRYFHAALRRGNSGAVRACILSHCGVPLAIVHDVFYSVVLHDDFTAVRALMETRAHAELESCINIACFQANIRGKRSMAEFLMKNRRLPNAVVWGDATYVVEGCEMENEGA